MKSNNKNDTPKILKIEHWNAKLPTGDWVGPEPLALFPKYEHAKGSIEEALAFRELHIQYHPCKGIQSELHCQ